MPPTNDTVLGEIFNATILPPMTARDVQKQCPRTPPMATPYGFLCVARAMVVIWLLSPHSAKKINTNASMNTGVQILAKIRVKRLRLLTALPFSNFSSTSSTSPDMDEAPPDLYAMYMSRQPKNVYNTNAALLTVSLLINWGTTSPSMTDSTVMIVSAAKPPARTMLRGFLIAMMAAMMKVSSPNSETRTIPRDETKPSLNPPSPSEKSSPPSED